jgi:hypothetical protein
MSEAKDTGKSRQIMWGGLARVAPNVVGNGHINHRSKVHRFPTEELSKIIHDEFLAHNVRNSHGAIRKTRVEMTRFETPPGCLKARCPSGR